MILVSPSQIKTSRACTRKWALEKLAGLRGPETASQKLGKEVDDNNLQPYLRDGKPIDRSTRAGAIAASGLDWLPQPKWRGLEVQRHFVFTSPSAKALGTEFGYQGYLDLWLPFGGQPGFFDEKPVVGDFKTTKSIRKWALKEEELRKDEQGVIYSVWAILETKAKEIHNSWLYMQTEGTPVALPTQITVHTDEVAHHFQEIEKEAQRIVKLRQAMPAGADPLEYALSLEGNKNACGDYGGCPFQHHCFKLQDLIEGPTAVAAGSATTEKTERSMSGTIDLFAKLKKKTQPDAVGAGAAETPAPAPSAPPTQEQIAAEPALGVNPPMPEGTPPAPPVGTVDAKPKRGRPRKTAAEAAPAAPAQAAEVVVFDEATFDAAWGELGAAVKTFLKVTKEMR